MIRFTTEHLEQRIRERAPGYESAVLRRASFLPDGSMEISEEAAAEIAAEFVPTRVLEKAPTVEQVVAVLTRRNPRALAEWQATGQPFRDAERHAVLKRLCDRCPDGHCRTGCVATPVLRWLGTAEPVGPHCLWPGQI